MYRERRSVRSRSTAILFLAACVMALTGFGVPATANVAFASDGPYHGSTVGHEDIGFVPAVRDSEGKLVWYGTKVFRKEEMAKRKGEKKAEEMNEEEGFIETEDCIPNPLYTC